MTSSKAPTVFKEGLTVKQEIFCQEYANHFNGKKAAIKAGYSVDCATQIATENLSKPYIKKRIDELQAESLNRLRITKDRVMAEIAKVAFGDARNLFDDEGKLKPLSEIDYEDAALIGGIEVKTERNKNGQDETISRVTKVKLNDKMRALEMAGKHLKLFTDVVESNVTVKQMGVIVVANAGSLDFEVGGNPDGVIEGEIADDE